MTEQTIAPELPGASAAPATGTPAIVDVHIGIGSDGKLECWHEWRWEGGPACGNGPIKIPQRKHHDPGTPIHFHLRDSSGRGFSFADDADGPIWVLRDSCPECNAEDPEIPSSKFRRSPKLLRVFNENSENCSLHYRLRFIDRHGNPDSYDPEIRNGGKS